MKMEYTPTAEKRVYTLRISQELYRKMQYHVFEEKADKHNRSINEYITDLILKDLGMKK
ncbi:MAG: hypothetical protein IJE10_04990 [Clostridia bacterium]|nr:hypothetical protein [Clostridia bacterium]